MSESKFVMAQKLHNVQLACMGMSVQDFSLDSLIPLIFKECSKEGLTFWFNFYVDHHWLCTCPQYYFRKVFCKHMKACAEMLGITDTMVYAEMET